MMIIVPGSGPQPSDWMVLAERPGIVESRIGAPLVGPSGEEHRGYCWRFGLDPRAFRLDNCVRSYDPDNTTPTAADLAEWAPVIEAEVRRTRPKVLVLAGGTATRWGLGRCDLDAVTGIPHPGGAFDPALRHRACGATVVPIYHPARGLHDDGLRPMVSSRYEMMADVVRRVARGLPITFPRDPYAGSEHYIDVSGREMARLVQDLWIFGVDTEGDPTAPYSIQVSPRPGVGYMLRCSREDFAEGIAAIQERVNAGALVCVHQVNGPDFSFYDMVNCRAMGLELRYARLWDSMYAAYLRRTEPQGLKALSYRHNHQRMTEYEVLLAGIGLDRQVEWLKRIMERKWEAPEPYVVREGDGSYRLYSPEPPHRAAKRIVTDVLAGKVNKEGEPVNPFKRWKNLDKSVRTMVAEEFGRMPVATLGDVQVEDAAAYGCADSDAPLRLYYVLTPVLEALGLQPLMDKAMSVMGFFEEMQAAGMPGSYSRFLALRDSLAVELDQRQYDLRTRYFGDLPFNPNSPKDVPVLMAERGLPTHKRTKKSGQISTSKKDIGHLQFVDDAMFEVFQYRERHKLLGSFINKTIDGIEGKLEDGRDIYPVRTNLKIARVITRRPSSSKAKSGEEVQLLNIPKRTKHGKMVRSCYVAPDGHVFVQADWSQCQMRLMADECRDPLLIELFCEDRDAYVETAARGESWGRGYTVSTSDISDDTRQAYKTACLGTIFGLQALGLRDQLWGLGLQYKGFSTQDCQRLLDSLLVTYPGIPRYFSGVAEELRGTRDKPNPHGEIRDRFGLPRQLPGIHSNDRKVVAASIREAVNFRMQAAEAGMMYNVIDYLWPIVRTWQETGVEVVPRLEIYDSLVFSCPEWFASTWAEVLLDAMLTRTGVELVVPIKADVSIGKDWATLDTKEAKWKPPALLASGSTRQSSMPTNI